jgi:universal stress protein E
MKTPARILCVVDPTDNELNAIDRAAWLCRHTGASLDLLVCYYDEYLSGQRYYDSPSLEKSREVLLNSHVRNLERLADPLRESGLKVTTSAVWDHPLYEGVVRHAAATRADLIVKGTQYHSRISRTLLTNTDWQLIRTSAAPLWLVKSGQMPANPTFIAAIDPMNARDKPAALDDEIVITGKLLAKRCSGSLHAFHAYDPSTALAAASINAYIPVSLPYEEISEEMREKHGNRFHEITDYHGISTENSHLVSGRTQEVLPLLVDQLDAAVVVMGAVARNRWKRLFIGATAERVLDQVPCDLLVVKPDWFRTPVEILHRNEHAA